VILLENPGRTLCGILDAEYIAGKPGVVEKEGVER
jgi:hypothetical protein